MRPQAIYSFISPEIKPYAAEPGAYGIACSTIDELPATIDITFTNVQGEPFNLTIPSSELNVGPFSDDPSTCQTFINALDGLELVGGSLLKHYYSVWDLTNQRMGFASNGGFVLFCCIIYLIVHCGAFKGVPESLGGGSL